MRHTLLIGAFVAVLAAFPAFGNAFHVSVLTLVFLFALLGQAWNIMVGFAGQLSLGHALYFGAGGYTVAVLAQNFGVTPWLGMPAAFAIAALLGALTAAVSFRFSVRGVYFALLTLAFAEFARIVFEHWQYVGATGGFFLSALRADNNPLVSLRGDTTFFYYALLVTMLAAWAASAALVQSRLGYFWRAIREDEDSARALGVNAFRGKVVAAAVSAGITATAGGWFALLGGSIFPETLFGMRMSIDMLVAPIVGGLGTLFGPILGAFMIVPLNELAKDLAQRHGVNGLNLLLYGVLLMTVVLAAPRGVWPWVARKLRIAP